MDSRPSKRQRRPIVLSSDDDEIAQAELRISKVKSGKSNLKSKSINDSTVHVLPSRHRLNTRSTAVRSRQSKSTEASPTFPKEPTLKGQTQKVDSTRSICAFFNTTNHAWPSRDELHHERLLSEVEDDDFIEDDSCDEESRKLPTTQTGARYVLDRRKRHIAPTQWQPTSKALEKVSNASQKFKIPQKDSLRQPLKNFLSESSRVDLRPWTERYGPRGLDELMVHKKKVADVKIWLENFRLRRDQKV